MGNIKEYKELTEIETFDGIMYTLATAEQLDGQVENSKFIQIGEDRIAVHQIKRYGKKKLDNIQSFIMSQPKSIREKLMEREKKKYELVGKKFESIQEVQNYIDKKING